MLFDFDTYEQCRAAARERQDKPLVAKPRNPARPRGVRFKYPSVKHWLDAMRESAPAPVEPHEDDEPETFSPKPIEREWLHLASEHKRIIAQVAERHGLQPRDVTGPGRTKKIVACRFEAICEVHKAYPHWSLPKLGLVFNRDHTSILHALQKAGPKHGVHRWVKS